MKNIKFLSIFMVLLLLIFSFAGCGEESGYPVTVGGAEITEAPKKVAVLSEQAASAIYSLGYKSYLVGAPSEFLTTERPGVTDLGNSMFIDFEKVYELAPDILIIPGELVESVRANLKSRNIEVVLLKTPTTYSEVSESERIITETKASLSGVTKRVALFVEEGYLATGDTIAGEAMKKAGMLNIADAETDYMMSAKEIREADPEVIFCPEGLSEAIMEFEAYKDITAVKNAAVYEVDVDALVYASEGFAATLQSMSKYLLQ